MSLPGPARPLCLFVALAALASGAAAQPDGGAAAGSGAGSIRGRVVDARSGAPLPGALAVIAETALQDAAGRDGAFRLAGVPAGEQVLVVTYLGYQTVTSTVTVPPGATLPVDVVMSESFALEETVTVSAGSIADGQTRALNQQKTAPNITNVVSADQIGQFPDANAAEATQRIPGITIERDQGEGRYVSVRGAEARLNSMLIDGERIPSPEGDVRAVALDVIPTDLLQAIEVSKALTPDMDGDAIGGAVNLVTKSAPETATVLGSLAGGYNRLMEDAGQGHTSLTGGGRFGDGRIGLIGTVSYDDANRGSDNLEPEYDDGELDDLQLRDYTVNRERTGLNGVLDVRPSADSSFTVRGVHNAFSDQEYRRRTRYRVGDDSIERELKDRLETQKITSFSAGGEHFLGNRVLLDYRASVARAEEDEPERHDTTFTQEDVAFAPNVSPTFIDPRDIQANPVNEDLAAFTLDDQVVENNLTSDRDVVAAANLRVPFSTAAGLAGSLKFGAKVRRKTKTRDNNALAYESDDDLFLADYLDAGFRPPAFLGGRYTPGTAFIAPNLARSLRNTSRLESEVDLEADLADYTATEDLAAAYAMADLALSSRLSLLTGLRFERTRLDYGGFELLFDEEGDPVSLSPVGDTDDYAVPLPSFHLRYAFTDDTNLRAAVTRSLARPNYYDLVPFQLILEEDSEIERGNPTLDPTTAWNLDLMAEHYLPSVGVVSAGLFHKDLTAFIFPATFEELRGGDAFDVLEPRNGGAARITGLELAFQNQFRGLPAPLDGLGLYANYTFADSLAQFPGQAREERLPGQARHSGNLSVWYEKRGFSARVSLNVRDRWLAEVGEEPAEDVYLDAHRQLDLSVGQALTSRLRLFADFLNLTN